MSIDLEKLKQVIEKKQQLEKEKEIAIDAIQKDIDSLDQFIEEQYSKIDKEMGDDLEPNAYELFGTLARVKKIKKSINTDGTVETLKNELITKFGDVKGQELITAGLKEGEQVKTTFSRARFQKGLKTFGKEQGLDLTEMIKAAEEINTEKTITFETIDIGQK